ncbi:MAG: hypothetical protein KAX65_08000 [Caldilineaceae bacterium]|nr:hypothetical protein [Caldilineaceae bacterium]
MTTTTQDLESAKLRYIEAAKIEQVVKELEARGYSVELDVAADKDPRSPRFDILAQRGDDKLAIEVKASGDTQSSAAQIAWLRKAARAQGIKEFQVMVAHPPQMVVANVEGLDATLTGYLNRHVPAEVLKISPDVVIDRVHELALREINVAELRTYVAGDGLVRVRFATKAGDTNGLSGLGESFPFNFAVMLDDMRHIVDADIDVDISSWDD